MYGVLIVPPARDVEAACQAMTRALGGSAYDHRQTLLRNVPVLVGWTPEPNGARALAATLATGTIEAFPVGRAALDLCPDSLDVRRFAFSDAALSVLTDSGQAHRLPWETVVLVLPCRSARTVEETTATTTKKQTVARVAMGIPIAARVTEVQSERTGDEDHFCLVYCREPELLLRLSRSELDYDGLGAARTVSATTNYLTLVARLRDRLGPVFDARLEKAGTRLPPQAAPPRASSERVDRKTTSKTTTVSWDTAGPVHQAARLLILATRLRRISTPVSGSR